VGADFRFLAKFAFGGFATFFSLSVFWDSEMTQFEKLGQKKRVRLLAALFKRGLRGKSLHVAIEDSPNVLSLLK